jgi:hypothetical protein
MIYIFVDEQHYNKEMSVGSDSVSTIEGYKALRFKDTFSVNSKLNEYKKFNKDTYKDIVVSIKKGNAPKLTIKDYDETGREVVRQAATDKGWAFLSQGIEFTTAKENSIFCDNWKKQNDFNNYYIKFYDDNDQEVTSDLSTRSVVTLDFGIDYDIIAGSVTQHKRPTDLDGNLQNVRLYTIIGIIDHTGTPFDPDGPGTAWKEQVTQFVGPINLKFVSENSPVETDGRAGKKLFKTVNENIPYNQNQIQLIVDHPVGFQHDIMVMIQYYRQP